MKTKVITLSVMYHTLGVRNITKQIYNVIDTLTYRVRSKYTMGNTGGRGGGVVELPHGRYSCSL